MVASVQRIKPHEVFDRHRTETGAHEVLATVGPSTTFLVEPGEMPPGGRAPEPAWPVR